MPKSSAKVIIVGAGLAGVSAAAWLTNNGLTDVIVLEAQDYIGGRVKGQLVDGKNIDYGAQFIHGWEGNPVFEIAHKLGRAATTDNESPQLQNIPTEFNTSKGDKIPYEKVSNIIQFLYDELEASDEESLPDDGASEGEFFQSAFKEFLDEHAEDASPEELELYNAIFRWYSAYSKVDNAAADLDDISAWGASRYVVLKGERFTDVVGGMAGLLKVVLDLVPKGIIRLNTPVKEVDWSSAGKNGRVLVTCQNGDVLDAEHVIVTISAGCMQAHQKEMFLPSLPDSFQTALHHISFGAIGKIFLKWEKPFWSLPRDERFASFELLWLDTHPLTIKSDKCQRKTRFGKPWWYGILSVETVFDHPNMLELWLTYDQVEIAETLEDDEVKSVCHELLSAFIKEYENTPEPVEIYRTKWLTNPYTRGTYSYLNCGARKGDSDNLAVQLPSPENPRLLFAGEAYARGFISTFHGALLTGLEAADVILNSHGIPASGKLIDLIDSPKK